MYATVCVVLISVLAEVLVLLQNKNPTPTLLLLLLVVVVVVVVVVDCLTSQQHASESQGSIHADNWTCCHTDIEVAKSNFLPHPVTVY